MCFGGDDPDPAPPPAPAPAAPLPVPDEEEVGSQRKQEAKSKWGGNEPNLRVDRSVQSGGLTAGRSGVRM